jgi:prophage DNA circulation protein
MFSPEGTEFNPKWKGNERTLSKKLGLYDYPDVVGTYRQDLNIKSVQYPLTVHFDGENYDLDADKFFKALGETGVWQVEHPVYGPLVLQLVAGKQDIQPVTNGGVATFTLDMFEPGDDDLIVSSAQLRSDVVSSVELSNIAAKQSFQDKLASVSTASKTQITNITGKISDATELILGPVAAVNNTINDAFNSIIRGIDDTLNAAVFEPLQLAGQLINLIQLPEQVIASTQTKLNAYKDLIDEIAGTTSEDYQALEVKDISLGAANSAIALVGSKSDAQSRSEIIDQILDVTASFNSIVVSLEADEQQFQAVPIDEQYISMQNTFADYWLTAVNAQRAMLASALDLAIEVRFTLEKYKLPIALVIEEYGDDTKLDFFYETNGISGSEFLLLPPGKEVVVFKEVA